MFRILLTGIVFLLPSLSWAASCVSASPEGLLSVNTVPVGECTSYILLSAGDWVGSSVWEIPSTDQLSLFWFMGFSLPITLYLISYSVGVVVSLLKS
jgi:hypothetical protein